MARFSRLSWTGSDYDSIRADVLQLVATTFPDWTKTNPADPGMQAFELLCYVGDLVRYYQDRQANEAFLITARQRQNVIAHLKMIGYRLATASPSTAALTFTLDTTYSTAVTFPQGSKVTTEDGTVAGELVDQLVIAAGGTGGSVDWIQGETVSEDVGESDGTSAQAFALAQTPYLWDSQTVVVDGVSWVRVDDFLSSTSSDQVYVVGVDAFDKASVTFGDGVNGAIPAEGALVSASYRIGGGVAGNVEAGSLTKFVGSITAADGSPVTFTVTNAEKADDGEDRETEEHGKLYGPRALATNGRAVTTIDYQTIAEGVAGVARALAQTSNEDATLAENTVHVQVVPAGSGTPSQSLLDEVEVALLAVMPNTTRLRVLPAVYLDVALVGAVYLRHLKNGQTIQASAIEDEADAILMTAAAAALAKKSPGALDTYFDAENVDVDEGDFTIDFGSLLPLSDLLGVPRDAGTLRKYVDLTSPVADVAVSPKLFPRLRSYTKAVLTSPDRVVFTWASLGTTLTVQEET